MNIGERDQEGIFSTKERVDQLKLRRQEISKELVNAQAAYQRELLTMLGATPTDPFAPLAEEVTSFAERENVDPAWLFQTVNAAGRSVQGVSPHIGSWQVLPEASTASEYYQGGIDIIRSEHFYLKPRYSGAVKGFEQATRLARGEEQASGDQNEQRMSAAYQFISDHTDTLYSIHSNYWDEHREERKSPYHKPTIITPTELSPLFDEEVRNIRSREARVRYVYDSREAREVQKVLEDFGFSVDVRDTDSLIHGGPETLVDGFWRDKMEEVTAFLDEKQQSFDQRLAEVTTKAQQPRMDLYRRIVHPLRVPMTIGVHWPITEPRFVGNEIAYQKGLKVGFGMPAVLTAIDFAVDNGLEDEKTVGQFLHNVERARQALSYDWTKRDANNGRDPEKQGLYTKYMVEHNPELQPVNTKFQTGLDLIFQKFIEGQGNENIEDARDYFFGARRQLAERVGSNSFDRALIGLLDFMSSTQAMILQEPTRLKYLYEQQSHKIFRV